MHILDSTPARPRSQHAYQPATIRLYVDMNTREFDYGIGDDIDDAVQKIRATIVAQIKRAALVDINAPVQVRRAYELAVSIAEGAS